MDKGLVLWLLGGSGTFLLYCAVKNVSPTSLLQHYFTGSATTPLTGPASQSPSKPAPQPFQHVTPGGQTPSTPNWEHLGVVSNYVAPDGTVQQYPSAYATSLA